MQNSHTVAHEQLIEVGAPLISEGRQRAGRGLIIAASLGLGAIIIFQSLYSAGALATGFENWRPVLYAYIPGSGAVQKGIVLGIAACLMMMVAVLPMAGAGVFGLNLGIMAPVMTLILHIIFGAVLGLVFQGRRPTASA